MSPLGSSPPSILNHARAHAVGSCDPKWQGHIPPWHSSLFSSYNPFLPIGSSASGNQFNPPWAGNNHRIISAGPAPVHNLSCTAGSVLNNLLTVLRLLTDRSTIHLGSKSCNQPAVYSPPQNVWGVRGDQKSQ